MPWQCGREAALRSSRAGRGPALGHLRARSLPPGRTRTKTATTATTSVTEPTRTTRRRPTRAAAKERKARAPGSSRGDSSTRRPNGLRDIRDAALRPGAGQGRAKREARRAGSLTGEDRGAAGDVGVRGVLRDGGDVVRDVAGRVAEIVSLRGLRGRRRLPCGPCVQKKFGEKGCQASFFSRSRRLPVALARGRSGRGARAPQRSEERRGPRPGLRARSASASAPRRRSRRHRCSMAWRGARPRRRRAEERSSRAPQARAAARSRATCPGLSAPARSRALRSPPAV